MGYQNQIMIATCLKRVLYLLVLIISQVKGQGTDPQVNVTFITDAIAKGAVCLDGSPGAYYFAQGFEDGVDNWIVYLPGGAWCNSKDDCLRRSKTGGADGLGSSKNAAPKTLLPIESPNKSINPDFYNWNKVYIRYCDGASFMADVEAVDPETQLYLRGRRIFISVLEELMATKGMANAANALLVGDSAGGLATILNCDRFSSLLPMARRVKCISDSGFFIQAKDLPEDNARRYFASIAAFHELAEFLPESCTQRMDPGLCLFPENVVDDIQTPLFLLNSDFDIYQITYQINPNPPDEEGWKNCTKVFQNLHYCTASQLHIIMDFHTAFLETVAGLNDNPTRGLFINSCYIHDFVYIQSNWQGTPTLQNKTVQQAFGDWYFERSSVQLIDTQHPYPINCNTQIV
ncbi:pectin acetylesterase 8-like isoform X2 [Salvia miltiorrhiza]|uniref:pectin acetylesterase 8-like isoform X2 n=1 Tax=Salvia miltiorrhiza TaxID=226208 RepID=UPI0025AD973F|nr:pectin acetylesterase 8-like isoform X2 [Salvia miltiorrhiza]XP_057786695.1 pectin acetylesterase 8-like isoform X2 [Salvia miltiorrhiza]